MIQCLNFLHREVLSIWCGNEMLLEVNCSSCSLKEKHHLMELWRRKNLTAKQVNQAQGSLHRELQTLFYLSSVFSYPHLIILIATQIQNPSLTFKARPLSYEVFFFFKNKKGRLVSIDFQVLLRRCIFYFLLISNFSIQFQFIYLTCISFTFCFTRTIFQEQQGMSALKMQKFDTTQIRKNTGALKGRR